MALEVEIQRPSGIEVKPVRGVSDLIGIVNEFLAGQSDKLTAKPDNSGLAPMLKQAEDFSQGIPQLVVDIIARNNSTIERLVKQYGIYTLAAAVALTRSGYLGSNAALTNTARALAEHGPKSTLKALQNHPPAVNIYEAARSEAAKPPRHTYM